METPRYFYHPDLSIWLSVDPLSDKYPNLTPYAYCANNPVVLVDPDGKEIDPTSMTEWNNQKQKIVDKKAYIDKRIDKLNATAKQKGWNEGTIKKRTNELKERSARLEKTLNTMGDLEKASTIYTLEKVDENGSFSKGFGDNEGKMVIKYSCTASFVHEVTHAGQYHNREIGFVGVEVTGYDITDEINAYKAGLAYDKYAYDNTYYRFSDITPEWVRKRSDTYKYLPAEPLNEIMYKQNRREKSSYIR